MHRVLGEHREKVALVDDQQPVQALAANGTDPAFGEGVGSWRLRRGPEHADAGTGEHVIEGQGELRVRSRTKNFTRCPTSFNSSIRLRACWVTQAPVG